MRSATKHPEIHQSHVRGEVQAFYQTGKGRCCQETLANRFKEHKLEGVTLRNCETLTTLNPCGLNRCPGTLLSISTEVALEGI